MFMELILELMEAGDDPKKREKAYRNLRHVGCDKFTADTIVKEFKLGGMLHGEIEKRDH